MQAIDMAIADVASTKRWTIPPAAPAWHEELVDQLFEGEAVALLDDTSLGATCDLNS